jgi:hypothetical protein
MLSQTLTKPFIELYLYLVYFTVKENEFLLSTISSSPYYDDKKFIFVKTLLKQIFQAGKSYANPLYIDFIQENSNKLAGYFKNTDTAIQKSVYVYIFHNLELIFGHLGLYRIKEVTDFIIQRLLKEHEPGTEIIQFSFTTYICISPNKDDNSTPQKKIDFLFDGITIPFKQKVIQLEPDINLFSFMDEIYTFENNTISAKNK